MNESFGEVVKYIPDDEVERLPELITRAQQQLFDVSVTKTTRYRFCPPYEGHYAFVDVVVRPFNQVSYPCFNVIVEYQLCCTTVDHDSHANDYFKVKIQEVYDTYIRPVQRKFDDGW
ncbi:hypothetical protein H2204_015567 [Knufia peltigerae]|uniref:Uncharacterized protein n=1 Tax=Knufia peltigerae TaxID=1002370 RepID=A0AA38X9E0_9EURO|nr:hypothetical protein H2204_015567 [Knufia peltigerae]